MFKVGQRLDSTRTGSFGRRNNGVSEFTRRVGTLSTMASELSSRHSVIKCRVVFALNQHRMKQELNVTARGFTELGDVDSVYMVPWRCALAGKGQREGGRETNGYMYWKQLLGY